MATIGDLRVAHFPQIPMQPFTVEVPTVEQGLWLVGVLADYDLFQYEKKIKPDYCNDGLVQRYEDNGNADDPSWYDVDENFDE